MSDREFASLQARRNAPFTSKTEKTRLTRQISKEIATRKAGSVSTGNAAPQAWKNLNSAISKHSGRAGSPENGVTPVFFPHRNRAAGFYDEVISRGLKAEWDPNDPRTVRVHKP